MVQHETPRVEALCLDAIGTIFEFVEPREVLIARILLERHKISVDPKSILARTTELRRSIPRGTLDMDEYWERWINPTLFRDMGIRRNLLRTIRRVRLELFSNPAHFRVKKDMRRFIEHFAERDDVVLAIASNHDRPLLVQLLKAHNLYECFEYDLIFTSKQIGHSKPSFEFFDCIRQLCNLESVEQLALLGNSLENDGTAWQHGVRICVLDRTGSLMRLRATIPAGITPARKMVDAWTWTYGPCKIINILHDPIEDDPSNGNGVVVLSQTGTCGK